MAATLTWVVPLVVGLLGGLGSAVVTQLLANRREDARWRRERAREQASWAREDAARSYEHRRDAYVDFVKEFNRRWNTFMNEKGRDDDDWPPFDYLDALYDSLGQIKILGTKEAAKLAQEAFGALFDVVFSGKELPYDVLVPLEDEIRRDLSIPSLAQDRASLES